MATNIRPSTPVYDVVYTREDDYGSQVHVFVESEFYGDAAYEAQRQLRSTAWGREFLSVTTLHSVHRIA